MNPLYESIETACADSNEVADEIVGQLSEAAKIPSSDLAAKSFYFIAILGATIIKLLTQVLNMQIVIHRNIMTLEDICGPEVDHDETGY